MIDPIKEGVGGVKKQFVIKLVTEGDVRRIEAQSMRAGKEDYVFTNPHPSPNVIGSVTVAAFPRAQVEYAMEAEQWVEASEDI